MTEPEQELEDPEQEDHADEGLPEMEQDEFADIDVESISDEVEAEAGEEMEEDAGDDRDDEASLGTGAGRDSWGDMYIGTLTTVSNAIIDEHGADDASKIDEDLARQLHLDDHFDEFMESRGKSDMPPEQALLLGTGMFLVVIIGTKTDIPSQLLSEVDF